MKKKHKFQKFLNSVVKSHGEIEEERKELENDVKKMLELFENNSEDASDRSNFVSILSDIKKRYHSLHGRHDGLIGKIKNKVHHRKGESMSGFSDSGSEDSSDEDEPNEIQEQKIVKQISSDDHQSFKEQIDSLSKRNAELEVQTTSMQTKLEESQHLAGELISRGTIIENLEDELRTIKNSLKLLDAENEFLKTEMEKSKEQEAKLNFRVSGLQEENEVIRSEKEKVSNRLLQADNSIIELEFDLKKMMEDARKLAEEKSFLKEELEKKAREMVNLNKQIVLIGEERETLKVVVTERESANYGLKAENERMLLENQNMKALMETAHQQISNQNDKLMLLEGENDAFKSQILKLSTRIHEADETIKAMKIESGLLNEVISKLQDTISDLNHQMKVKDNENCALALESSESRKLLEQAEERIMILSVDAESLKTENSMFVSEIENLKLELESNNQELSKHKQSLEAAESKMNSLTEENTLLLSFHENLKLELDHHKQELSKIKQALEATEYGRNSLVEEKIALLRTISEGGMVFDGLKAQIEEVQSEKSLLELKIDNMNLEKQSADFKFSDVKNALVTAEEENKALVSENSAVKSKLQEIEFTKETLQTKLEELNQKNSILLSRIEEAEKDMITESDLLKKDISSLHETITDLNHHLKVKNDEIYAMTTEFLESKKLIQQAEEKIIILSVEADRLKSENYMLLGKHQNLMLEQDSYNQELSKHKQAFEEIESEINSLREEKSLLLSGHDNLKLELKGNNNELLELKKALEATKFERNSLIEEKSALLNKIDESGMAIDGLKSQVKEVESEKSQLQLKIIDLDLEIHSANLRFTDVKNALVAAEEEKKVLILENSAVEGMLQETKLAKEIIETELRESNQKNSILLSKIEEAEKSSNELKFERNRLIADNAQLETQVSKFITELEAANIQLIHLEKLKFSAEDEKLKFLLEISILTDKLQLEVTNNERLERERDLLREENTAFEQNQEALQNKMADHYKNLEISLSEMQDLKDKLEQAQKEVLHEFQTWTDTFKGDFVVIVSEKSDIDQELKKLADISSENAVSLKKMEDILRSEISDKATLLRIHEEFLTKHKQLEDSYYDSCVKLETLQKKLEQIEMKEEIIQKLERICLEQKNDISKCSENCRELLEKLSSTEVGKVDAEKEIQRLEVQLRLSNQKLKITETECKEKEENYKKLISDLQEELRSLDKYVLILSRMSTELNNELKQIIVVVENCLKTLFNELHVVKSISLENMGHIKEHSAECLFELHNIMTLLKSELHEKKNLKNENHELAVGLSYKEEVILNLKDEASRNLARLAEKEKMLRILESRIAESENNLKEKERVVLDKDEEKREAIRQLCLVIDYHWENRNYLVRYLSSMPRNRGMP